MKKISFMIAALLVAMTGCQKEPQVNPENNPGSNAETVGYVALKISLPSSTGTKADPTGGFDDGKAEEYKVNDITVVFYDDNGTYQTHESVDPKPIWNNNSAADITVSGKTPAIEVKQDVKNALVLVNAEGVISDFEQSYDAINAAITNASAETVTGASKDDFFMSNAPRYEGDKFTTLVPVTVCANETDALNNAKNVQVERAAAKVQVTYNGGNLAKEPTKYSVSVKGWGLDVTNRTFFPVRKGLDKEASNGWFDASSAWVNAGMFGTRIYMAVDPNYSETYASFDADNFDRIAEDYNYASLASEDVAYCLENTFAIGSMNENQTTTIMLKANFAPEGIAADATWFMVGPGKTVYSDAGLVEYIKSKLTAEQVATVPADLANTLSANAGEVADVMVAEKNSVMLNDLVGEVICYKDGICYYPVKVRHFTAAELGYADEAAFKVSFEGTPAGYKANDLGRYGVLRNTWYNITVNSISNPGSPEVPDPDNIPDDKFEQYVACTIDILAWSVRNHEVDL